MPYLTYCCEVWGNNYKTRIQSLFILQKRAIRICMNTNYKCHTKPLFYQLRSLNVFDTIDLNSLVFNVQGISQFITYKFDVLLPKS